MAVLHRGRIIILLNLHFILLHRILFMLSLSRYRREQKVKWDIFTLLSKTNFLFSAVCIGLSTAHKYIYRSALVCFSLFSDAIVVYKEIGTFQKKIALRLTLVLILWYQLFLMVDSFCSRWRQADLNCLNRCIFQLHQENIFFKFYDFSLQSPYHEHLHKYFL